MLPACAPTYERLSRAHQVVERTQKGSTVATFNTCSVCPKVPKCTHSSFYSHHSQDPRSSRHCLFADVSGSRRRKRPLREARLKEIALLCNMSERLTSDEREELLALRKRVAALESRVQQLEAECDLLAVENARLRQSEAPDAQNLPAAGQGDDQEDPDYEKKLGLLTPGDGRHRLQLKQALPTACGGANVVCARFIESFDASVKLIVAGGANGSIVVFGREARGDSGEAFLAAHGAGFREAPFGWRMTTTPLLTGRNSVSDDGRGSSGSSCALACRGEWMAPGSCGPARWLDGRQDGRGGVQERPGRRDQP
eukprot:scaffold764_cov248-Pinguiococcus_pyrenoidosus.AAC.13